MTLPGADAWPVTTPLDYPVRDLLRERARSSPDSTAIVDADSGRRWTYATFDRRVSARLTELEPTTLDGRVGLLLNTGAEFAEWYFATARSGGTVVPLDVRRDGDTLRTRAEKAEIDLLVHDPNAEVDAEAVAPGGVRVVSADGQGTSSTSLEGPSSPGVTAESTPDSERSILFTSGTTGEPKGVRLTLGNLVSSAVGSAARLDVAPDDRWLICLPMYHMGGFAPLVRSTLYGTTVVLQGEFDPEATAAVVAEREVTCLSLVPTMLTRLLDAGWTPPSRLRFVLLGGGPASTELVDRCEERGVPVCPTYGATETASQLATALPETAFAHPGTVGRPLRETTVSIVDDDVELGAGEVGQIVVDGPTVTPGYLAADNGSDAFGERGFETGDLGYRDEAGRLWVVGRVDDRIVTGGENVRPAPVAATIGELDGVDDVVVLGLPDEEWGERVGALVASRNGSVTSSEVRNYCRANLAAYEVPKTVRFVGSLPRTASGTVDREAARRLLSGE